MAKMISIICECGCGKEKQVRAADVARGWGRFHSKSCKMKEQAVICKTRKKKKKLLRRDEDTATKNNGNLWAKPGAIK